LTPYLDGDLPTILTKTIRKPVPGAFGIVDDPHIGYDARVIRDLLTSGPYHDNRQVGAFERKGLRENILQRQEKTKKYRELPWHRREKNGKIAPGRDNVQHLCTQMPDFFTSNTHK
jgi:hypothetical protein